ncbi:MAG: AraC family transcriptional regulator [Butyrivibrio sp.]|uniref:helix-turn-helix domain-containing protein n=1 Tax=Butyrivibrio sp. TaxID=28121 RepID=UPI0025CD0AC7|nr:AraC family transcriptional regulator [Butyrivibrio sp.]MCR5769844.1 AraC family transcriptional regulator [Butyrivibrio sp.]
MISVDAIGYRYVHTNGWDINRPSGLNKYLFLHIETPADILIGDEMVYYPEPCFIMFKKGQRQHFHNHKDMTYIDSWIHFNCESQDSNIEKSKNPSIEESKNPGIDESDIDSSNMHNTKAPDEIESLINELDIPWGQPIVLYNTIELSDLWQLTDAEFHQAGSHKRELLDMKMRALIYKFADVIHSESGTPSKFNRYRKAFGELRNSIFSGNNAAAITDVTELALSQNMSLSYFEHVYKELFQVPVTKDIIKSRITYAKYLLRSTDNSIQDIARYCGYENIEHFNRQFKATVGYTPTSFRSQ